MCVEQVGLRGQKAGKLLDKGMVSLFLFMIGKERENEKSQKNDARLGDS